MDRIDEQLWDVFEAIMEARGWGEAQTVDLLEANWARFVSEGKVRDKKEKTKRGGKKKKRKVPAGEGEEGAGDE